MTQVSRKGFRDKNGQQVAIVPNVPGATAGNIASFDADGNLQDSGYDPTDFAGAVHQHNNISGYRDGFGASVYAGEGDQGEGVVRFRIAGDGGGLTPIPERVVEIGYYAAENLQRALQDPNTEPTENSNKLVTSGGVYNALESKEDEHPILALTLQKTENGKYPLTETDAQSLSSFVSAFPNLKTIPCLVNIDEVATPAFVSRRDQRLGSNGPIRNFVLLSFSNRLFITNPSIATDNFWQELNEDMVVIKLGSIYIVRNDSGTSFPIASKNDVKAGLESFVNNHEEGVTFIEMIRVVDTFKGKSFNPTASISWARRQMSPTNIDVVVSIGGTKVLTATATVPEDSLDTFTWGTEWDFKDYSSSLSIESNS